MEQTVSDILTAATDSVTLINSISDGTLNVTENNQSEVNDLVKRNVDHLETVLEYTPLNEEDDTPDVVGSSVDKTSYEQAIATGKSYIESNS
jgi:hypothetical protein